MDNRAAIAAIRFGLGRTPGQDPAPGPEAWLRAQLAGPDPAPRDGATIADAFTALRLDREDRRARKAAGSDAAKPPAKPPARARAIFHAETQALLGYAAVTATPFRERLVRFWANHFTVSIRNGGVAPFVGAYVRDAIRPHVTGRFADMLLAVMRHPAMLIYLDNVRSAGPNSQAGLRRHRGLNENLARECLELHTVGAEAGYTQRDVTQFAAILTGWSVEPRQEPLGFRFRPMLHEPGGKTLMGHAFPDGEQGGEQALAWLADHPATHRHLATKLVRHFVADTPPEAAVRAVQGALRNTHGNLGAAALAVIDLPGAWQPLTKLRSPQDFLLAAMRAAAMRPTPIRATVGLPAMSTGRPPNLQALSAALGEPAFNAPLPNGWPDTAAEWASPEGLMRRVDWAYGYAGRPDLPEPMQLADAALGPLLTPSTAAAIRHAGSRRDGITLLLASPELQRR